MKSDLIVLILTDECLQYQQLCCKLFEDVVVLYKKQTKKQRYYFDGGGITELRLENVFRVVLTHLRPFLNDKNWIQVHQHVNILFFINKKT